MADERSCPRSRDVDRLEVEVREVREKYVLKELFVALVERVRDLEEEATSIRRNNRVAILAGIGAVVTGIVLQFITKGSAH